MATYKKGSRSDEVKRIQEALGIKADGIYGSQTERAVRNYQQQNGLKVDGIVGNNTWGSLFGGGSGGFDWSGSVNTGSASGSYSSQRKTADWLSQYETGRPTYSPSQAVNDAANMLADYERNRPAAFKSRYDDRIQSLLDQILNRGPFEYDFNADPLYQQYKDQYTQQGKIAMMDTMGQAAALTGGYGSSYGSVAGQQAYQGYLQQLNNVIPELRDAAFSMYQAEGDNMRSKLGVLSGLDDTDYGRYRDTVSDYYNDLNYYYNKYNDMSEADYNRYLNDAAAWENDRAYWYNKAQDEQTQANWQAEYDMAAAKAGYGGSGSGRSSGRGYNNGSLTSAQIRQLQALLGVAADGKYGSKSMVAAGGLDADAAWAKYFGGRGGSGSDKLSESEFNRSSAMRSKYGTYSNYLNGGTGRTGSGEPSVYNNVRHDAKGNIKSIHMGNGYISLDEFDRYLAQGKIKEVHMPNGKVRYEWARQGQI